MRKKYLSMAIVGALLAGTTTGFAAEAAKAANTMDEYALDEVVVTATRSEKSAMSVTKSVPSIICFAVFPPGQLGSFSSG